MARMFALLVVVVGCHTSSAPTEVRAEPASALPHPANLARVEPRLPPEVITPAIEAEDDHVADGEIFGTVWDTHSGEPLPGTTIVVTSPMLQGAQAALTDEDGFYLIDDLRYSGDYVVNVLLL